MSSEISTPIWNLAAGRNARSRLPEERVLVSGLILADALAIASALILAYVIRFMSNFGVFQQVTPSEPFYRNLVIILVPWFIIVFALFGLYDTRILLSGTTEYARVFNACTTALMAVIVAGFIEPAFVLARGWLLLSWGLAIVVDIISRFCIRRLVHALRRKGLFTANALVVGADPEGKAVAEQLRGTSTCGLCLVGFLDDQMPVGSGIMPGLGVLGTTMDIQQEVEKHGVTEIVVVPTALSRQSLLDIFEAFGSSEEVKLRLTSGLYELVTTGVHVKEFGSVPLLSIDPVRLTGLDVFVKSCLDYAIAFICLILLLPILLVIAILIKLDSPGPVLYRRRVLGLKGKRLEALKFRTMVVNGDEMLAKAPELLESYRQNAKLKDDPRVTRLGKTLRRTSLDEVPQLFNVLRGEMSLVGPRMIAPDEHERYEKWGTNLLTVKPGITGLWQVSGRADIPYEERVELDMYYIRNYSVWTDIKLLYRTIGAVLRGKGAY